MVTTMNPVLLHGRSVWDQNLFPVDECEERLRSVQAEMTRRDLQCLVVFGHCAAYEDLCYLTQYIPMLSWGMVVVPLDGDPVLGLGFGGSREIPASRARTWVSDVRALRDLGADLREILAERRIGGRVGLVGADRSLTMSLHAEVVESIGEERCLEVDDLLIQMRMSLRPREISAVRRAACVVKEAAASFTTAIESGATNSAAMVAADGVARRLGALDFRGLVNLREGAHLEPVMELSTFRSSRVVAYLAVCCLGYWADLSITIGVADHLEISEPRDALEAMCEHAHAGALVSDVARAAIEKLGATSQNGVFGSAIGLSLAGAPIVMAASDAVLHANSILSLRIGLDDVVPAKTAVSDLVLVGDDGCKSLFA